MSTEDETEDHQKWRNAVRDVLRDMPADPFEMGDAVENLHREFSKEVSVILEPRVSEFLKGAPQHTRAQKRDICARLDALFKQTGVCPRCPGTGHAARLVVHYYDTDHDGHFRLEVTERDGRRIRPHRFETLTWLDLRAAPHRGPSTSANRER